MSISLLEQLQNKGAEKDDVREKVVEEETKHK